MSSKKKLPGRGPKIKVKYQGREVFIRDLAKKAKVSPYTFRTRVLVLNWPIDLALNTPPLRGRQKRPLSTATARTNEAYEQNRKKPHRPSDRREPPQG